MPRAGLDAQAVVAAATALADAEGLDAVTLARVARALGVQPPSLYAHVSGLADVRERIAARAAAELADALQAATAGRAGRDALHALADAYRTYAHAHPGAYAAVQRAGYRSGGEAATAGERVVDTVLAVLRGYGLEGDDALHATRALRSALHGFVSLEAVEGFGLALATDESFARLVDVLDRGLRERAPA